MTNGRQTDYRIGKVKQRRQTSMALVKYLTHRKLHGHTSGMKIRLSDMAFVLWRYKLDRDDEHGHINLREQIFSTDFSFNFDAFTDLECLINFRFTKKDILRLLPVLSWPPEKTHTHRNRYGTSPILSTCVILRRLASPTRWEDCKKQFGKWPSHLSEIFWEGVEHFLDARKHLILDPIDRDFISARLPIYANAVYEKSKGLQRVVGFIDGTVLGIARPKGNLSQRVVYNGHKRKHSLKYQALSAPDGLFMHVAGPIEGHRHDWTLYIKSDLEENLPFVLERNGVKFRIYGDSGYSQRWFLQVPFQDSDLSDTQKAFNNTMSQVRITVEMMFEEVKLYFATIDCKRKMKVNESPIGLLYLSSMLLCDMRNCIYPNEVSKYFHCHPPSLEGYVYHK